MYNDYPNYKLEFGEIYKGWDLLSQEILKSKSLVWIFDGPHYLNWELIKSGLNISENFVFVNFEECILDKEDLKTKISDLNLYTCISYGFPCPVSIRDFLSEAKTDHIKQEIDTLKLDVDKKIIIYGAGSSLLNYESSKLCWVELPVSNKNYISDKSLFNKKRLCGDLTQDFDKSFQYIDEPITRKNRTEIINQIHLFIYLNSEKAPLFTLGSVIRDNMKSLSCRPFRIKPVFFEKIWGGQFLRMHTKNEDAFQNIAGSYEMVSTKNNVIFTYKDFHVEIPFDLFVSLDPLKMLGRKVIESYGKEIPFCIYLTDTINGGDLSCQVHPTKEYNKAILGSDYLMEEMYYVVKSEDLASINLGFVENCDLNEFRARIRDSEISKTQVDLKKYIKNWKTKQGSVFHIPPGSIHNICKNNLVMEVISSNNIITFRFYDFLRKNQDESYRKLDIDDAWNTLNQSVDDNFVRKNLIPRKKISKKEKNWVECTFEFRSPTVMKISEITFSESYEDNNLKPGFHVLNLVEGERVLIECGDTNHILNYLETIVIPAATGRYKVINQSNKKSVILKVKPNV